MQFLSVFFLLLGAVPLTLLAQSNSPSAIFLGAAPSTVSSVPIPAADLSSFGVDGTGNTYYADAAEGSIVKDSAGVIATLFEGLHQPKMQVDLHGNVFIADTNNDRILELEAGPTYHPHILARPQAPSAIAVDAAQNIFVLSDDQLVYIKPNGTLVNLSAASGAAFLATGPMVGDSSTLYLVTQQTGGYRASIYTYNAQSPGEAGVPRLLFAENTSAHIASIAVENSGNLLLSETSSGDGSVVSTTPTGFATTLANGVTAGTPLAVDADRNLFYLAPAGLQKVQLGAVDLGSASISQVYSATNPSPAAVTLKFAVPSGISVITLKTSGASPFSAAFTNGTGCDATDPCSITAVFAPEAGIPGSESAVILLQDANGGTLASVPVYARGTGSGLTQYASGESLYNFSGGPAVAHPSSLAIRQFEAPAGPVFYVTDVDLGELISFGHGNPQVVRSGLNQPAAVAASGEYLYIAQEGAPGILRIANDSSEAMLAPQIHNATGLASDVAGNIYIAAQSSIYKLTPDGALSTFADGDTDGGYKTVYCVAVSDDGIVYAAFGAGGEQNKGGVIAFDRDAVATYLPIKTTRPSGLSIDAAGNLFLVDIADRDVIAYFKNGQQMTISTSLRKPVAIATARSQLGNTIVICDSILSGIFTVASATEGYFGSVPVGSTSTVSTVLSSSGTDTLTAKASYGSSHKYFTLESPATLFSLAPGATTELTEAFTPKAPGSYDTTLLLTTNFAGSSSIVESPIGFFFSGAAYYP